MDEITSENILLKAIEGTKWVILSKLFAKLIQPVVTIILARLLLPEEFGVVAMAAISIGVIGLFQDLGTGAALIQKKDNIIETANVVFFTNIFLGVSWYLVLFLLAPYIALYFRNDLVTPILRVAALGLLLGPFASVQGALLSRNLSFRKLFFLGVGPLIVSGTVSILLALYGFGVWSLIYGSLAGAIFNVCLFWLVIPWRPRWKFNIKIAREILGFGGYVSLENILAWGITTVDNIFVGHFLGARQLGIYQMGFNLALWPAINITGPLGGILYPTFSKMQGNIAECKRIYLRLLRIIALVSMPTGLIIAFCAHQLILVFLGKQWNAAVPVVQILAVVGVVASIVSIAPSLYRGLGRADIMPKFFTVRMIFSIPAYYFAAQEGLIALCIAHLSLVLVFAPINFYITMKFLRISLKEVLDTFALPVMSTLILALVVLGLSNFLAIIESSSNLESLLIIIPVAIGSYLLTLRWLGANTLHELKRVFRVALS